MKVHCLFEQSGTFKNEFLNLGIDAFDYDIVQTPHVDKCCDLLNEINKCYHGYHSIFAPFGSDDLVIAFYPCIRFTDNAHLLFTGNNASINKWDIKRKLEYDLKLHDELHTLYLGFVRLFLIAQRLGFQLIVENPYSKYHYMKYYFCIEPLLVDTNRMDMGDYYIKPTQYWFFNCVPHFNFVLEPLVYHERLDVQHEHGFNRSRISSDYANRFIKQYIL